MWEVAAVVPTTKEREKVTVVEVAVSALAESGKAMVSVAVAAWMATMA